jgi:hypothetical protein
MTKRSWLLLCVAAVVLSGVGRLSAAEAALDGKDIIWERLSEAADMPGKLTPTGVDIVAIQVEPFVDGEPTGEPTRVLRQGQTYCCFLVYSPSICTPYLNYVIFFNSRLRYIAHDVWGNLDPGCGISASGVHVTVPYTMTPGWYLIGGVSITGGSFDVFFPHAVLVLP